VDGGLTTDHGMNPCGRVPVRGSVRRIADGKRTKIFGIYTSNS